MKKLPVKRADGSIVLIELDSIYYLEACGSEPGYPQIGTLF
jgi:hypothetical protein